MYTKAEIYNLALGALLLTKRISDVDTDTSAECVTLNVHWPTALRNALIDLDLDAVSTRVQLELIKECPVPDWKYAYKYPTNCTLFRRVMPICHNGGTSYHHNHKDIRSNQVKRQIANYMNQKVIFCNKEQAWGEFIPTDMSLNLLSGPAALAIAYKLAQLAAPLISGKGAAALRKEIQNSYVLVRAEAMQHDRMENATFDEEWVESEFVQARIS